MKSTRLSVLILAAIAAAVLLATGAGAIGVDPSTSVILEGPVTAFTGGLGAGMPTLTVDDAAEGETTVRIGPFWFLAGSDFTAAVDDIVRVVAYPCTLCSASWVAGSIENLSTGASVALRDEDGVPLWIGSTGFGPDPDQGYGGGNGPAAQNPQGKGHGPAGPGTPGQGAGGAGNCPHFGGQVGGFGPGAGMGFGLCDGTRFDIANAVTATGTVVSFIGEPGVRFPVLTLEVDGEEIALVAGPYRAWFAAGFEPVEGQILEVTYAPVTLADATEHFVILAVTDPASGLTVIVRDADTGRPVGGRCGW